MNTKMKLSLIYFIALCLSVITVFSSCTQNSDSTSDTAGQTNTDGASDSDEGSDKVHPLEKFGNRIKETESYQLTTTVDAFLMNMFSVKTQVDGNIQYIPATFLSDEEYIEITEEYEYTYTKSSDGSWQKTARRITNSGMDDFSELFEPDNFEKVSGQENKYRQKDGVVLNDYEDVEITLSQDVCEMYMLIKSEGYYVTLVFDKVGEIDLTLPKVD